MPISFQKDTKLAKLLLTSWKHRKSLRNGGRHRLLCGQSGGRFPPHEARLTCSTGGTPAPASLQIPTSRGQFRTRRLPLHLGKLKQGHIRVRLKWIHLHFYKKTFLTLRCLIKKSAEQPKIADTSLLSCHLKRWRVWKLNDAGGGAGHLENLQGQNLLDVRKGPSISHTDWGIYSSIVQLAWPNCSN